MKANDKYLDQLINHLLGAETPKEMKKMLEALLTPSELQEIPRRLQIFKMLKAGIPQREIAKKLGVGIATVTRGSRALSDSPEQDENYGKNKKGRASG